MGKPHLTSSEEAIAKALATEIVVLALLQEKKDDAAFWQALEKTAANVMTSFPPRPDLHPMTDAAQDYLDVWRQLAQKGLASPNPEGSLPFDPAPN